MKHWNSLSEFFIIEIMIWSCFGQILVWGFFQTCFFFFTMMVFSSTYMKQPRSFQQVETAGWTREFSVTYLQSESLHRHFPGPKAKHTLISIDHPCNLLLNLLLDVLSGLSLEQARTNSEGMPLEGALGCYTHKLQDSALMSSFRLVHLLS